MFDINHILVVVDQHSPEQPALNRALWLANALSADLTIVSNTFDAYGDSASTLDKVTQEALKAAVLSHTQLWLEGLLETITYDQIKISSRVIWCKHAHEAVLTLVHQGNFDLVIKATKRHTLMDRFFLHTDWNLLRHCPAPVLLVKSSEPWQRNRILASIDATSPDEGHQLINDNILSYAEHLADHFDTDLHLANAYPTIAVAFAMIPEVSAPDDIQQYITRQHDDAAEQWARKFNVNNDHIHIGEGETEQVIVNISKEIKADLVVVGTIGRSGISGVLIGNTAERLVDDLDCDVLVIKPQDGVDPSIE